MGNENQRIDTFANRLNAAMNMRNVKQADLVESTGLSKQKINQYVNGKFEAKQQAVFILAQALDVNEAWLMGYDVPMERITTAEQLNCCEEKYNADEKLTKEVHLIEQIQKQYGKEAVQLLHCFSKLNAVGKEKAIENLSDLAALEKYTEQQEKGDNEKLA